MATHPAARGRREVDVRFTVGARAAHLDAAEGVAAVDRSLTGLPRTEVAGAQHDRERCGVRDDDRPRDAATVRRGELDGVVDRDPSVGSGGLVVELDVPGRLRSTDIGGTGEVVRADVVLPVLGTGGVRPGRDGVVEDDGTGNRRRTHGVGRDLGVMGATRRGDEHQTGQHHHHDGTGRRGEAGDRRQRSPPPLRLEHSAWTLGSHRSFTPLGLGGTPGGGSLSRTNRSRHSLLGPTGDRLVCTWQTVDPDQCVSSRHRSVAVHECPASNGGCTSSYGPFRTQRATDGR